MAIPYQIAKRWIENHADTEDTVQGPFLSAYLIWTSSRDRLEFHLGDGNCDQFGAHEVATAPHKCSLSRAIILKITTARSFSRRFAIVGPAQKRCLKGTSSRSGRWVYHSAFAYRAKDPSIAWSVRIEHSKYSRNCRDSRQRRKSPGCKRSREAQATAPEQRRQQKKANLGSCQNGDEGSMSSHVAPIRH
jgi:hypothetical protein